MTLERINELTPREAILVYCTAMTAWIVFFAATETALPAVAVLVLLLVPLVVHFGLGYVVDDWKALYFTGVPSSSRRSPAASRRHSGRRSCCSRPSRGSR